MADDFAEAPEETRDTPTASSYDPPVDHDEEPEERKDSAPHNDSMTGKGVRPAASPPAGQAPPDPDQAAVEQALAALEQDPLYQQLPAGYKRKVLAGQLSVPEAAAQRTQHLMAMGSRNSRALTKEQERGTAAIQELQETHRQTLVAMESRMAERLERFMRQMNGEPEPEVKAAGPLDPRDQLLLGVSKQIEGLAAIQTQQAEEQLIRREMQAVEEYSAADVERAVAAVPWYEQAESYVEEQAFTAELLAINNAYPELSDAQAERYAAQRVMEMASNLMVEARSKGVSLAAEVIGMAQRMGFRPQEQAQGPPQTAAPPAPRPGTPAYRLADQQRREASVVGATNGGRGTGGGQNLNQMSRDIATAAMAMTDEDFDAFLGEGKEGDKRFRQIVSQRAE